MNSWPGMRGAGMRFPDCANMWFEAEFTGPAHRVFHLLEYPITGEDNLHIGEKKGNTLPDRLSQLLPSHLPRSDWGLLPDDFGCLYWTHTCSAHGFWTLGTPGGDMPNPLFWLPWPTLVEDIISRSGGMMHAGLAVLHKRGYLFSAPSGGGKTTTVSRLPSPWEMLTDDTVLVWPTANGVFVASPLPATGSLRQDMKPLIKMSKWEFAKIVEVERSFFLVKADHIASGGNSACGRRTETLPGVFPEAVDFRDAIRVSSPNLPTVLRRSQESPHVVS